MYCVSVQSYSKMKVITSVHFRFYFHQAAGSATGSATVLTLQKFKQTDMTEVFSLQI